MDKLKIAVSTDPPENLIQLNKYVKQVEKYVDFLHFDIMDGKFVERTTYTHKDIEFTKLNTLLVFDVHLMIEHPEKYIKNYAKAGANIITIHYESFEDKDLLVRTLNEIKRNNCLVGLSINPDTNEHEIHDYLPFVDLVLVMSVYPGKSGQKFIEDTYDKVQNLRKIKEERNLNFLIEVDGGIDNNIAPKLNIYGADIIVSGSYLYNNKDNIMNAVMDLQKIPKLL